MAIYQIAFEDALLRTKHFGLNPPEVYFFEGSLIHSATMTRLTDAIKPVFKRLDLEEIGEQALSLHQNLKTIAEEIFEADAVYTIGSVTVPPQHYFEFTDKDITRVVKKIKPPSPLKLHAWLTFPTMEVLDFSINTRLSAILNQPEIAGRILAGRPDTFSEMIQFHPKLLGDQFLKQISPVTK